MIRHFRTAISTRDAKGYDEKYVPAQQLVENLLPRFRLELQGTPYAFRFAVLTTESLILDALNSVRAVSKGKIVPSS